MRSEPRFCFIKNQNKEKKLFLKVASWGKLFCNASSCQEFWEVDHGLSFSEATLDIFLEKSGTFCDKQITLLSIVLLRSS